MEFAFGADPLSDPADWDWTRVEPANGSLLLDQQITVQRGRADEQSDVSPTTADMEIDNPDGDYTPDDARSPYWPNVDVGTPGRWWVEAGLSRLYLTPAFGSNAQIASSAALNITTDLDVRIDMQLKTMGASTDRVPFAGRGIGVSGGFSWSLSVYPDQRVRLGWTTNGTGPVIEAISLVPVAPANARQTLRATLDVNNGAGGWTVRFYTSPAIGGPFTQIGDPVTGVGVTSVFNGTQPLLLGTDVESISTGREVDADVYGFVLLDGIGGSALVNADFTAQPSGTTSFVDTAGRTWNISAAAELSNRWFRVYGTVDEWKPVWPYGDLSDEQPGGLGEGEARVELTISGILRRLGQGASPLESPLRRDVLTVVEGAPDPTVAYWPMEDLDGSTQIASALPGGQPMIVAGEIDYAADSTLPGSKSLPTLDATTSLSGPVISTPGPWEVRWYQLIPTAPATTTIMQVTTDGTVVSWVVTIAAGIVTVSGIGGLGTVITTVNAAPTDVLGGWVLFSLSALQSSATVVYNLTWWPVVYPQAGGAGMGQTVTGSLGVVTAVGVPAAAGLEGISMGHVKVLVGGVIGASPSGAGVGWVGETAVERMDRLSTEQGVPFRVIGDGTTTELMGVQQVATYVTLMDDAQDVDGGILYEQRDRIGLVYRTRQSFYNQPPNLVLDAHQQQIQNPFRPILDDQRIRNDVTVTRRGGSSGQVTDDESIKKRGRYDDSVTLNLYADTQILGAAGWRLRQGTVPGMRYPQLSTRLGPAPELIEEWLAVDIGSRVHVVNLPPQHPLSTVRVIAEGYSEPVTSVTWDPEMNCSAASVWDVGQLPGEGVPEEYLGRLDTDGSQLGAAIDADDTTMLVVVTAGPAWTSDAAEVPFDLLVGGERMTVTDIDAPTGADPTVGGGSFSTVASTNHVAPSVLAAASGDLLICGWCSFDTPGAYTLPGGMGAGALTSGTFSSARDATQTLGASGATGTRTATHASDTWAALSIAAHAASGSPTVVDYVSGLGAGVALTLTSAVSASIGDTLLILQAWDYDPGNAMRPPDDTWTAVADSGYTPGSAPRWRAWRKLVTVAGIQSVTFAWSGGVADNHGRLYILRGITGVTQLFTVTRSINSVVRAHAIGTDVRLFYPLILAR